MKLCTLLTLTLICSCYSSKVYDYVIVGGGGAGCLFANRLSQNPKRQVLVLERGVEECSECDVGPGSPTNLQLQPPWDPNYFTTSQLPTSRSMHEVRFSGAGGSTRIYGSLAVPSSPQILNRNPVGYRYADLLPYMKKVQNHFCFYLPTSYTGISPSECLALHGNGGPMDISPFAYQLASNLTKDLVTLGTAQMNVSYSVDYFNSTTREGIHPIQFFRRRSDPLDPNSPTSRESTWTGYLPASLRAARKNLHLHFNATVVKLLFSGNKVTGVEYYYHGKFVKVHARKQVILAAGAIESTKILQLSGIGPSDILNQFGIDPIFINPNVGTWAKGHFGMSTCYSTTQDTFPNTTVSSFDTYVMFLKSDPTYDHPNIEVEILAGACVDTYNYAVTGFNPAYFTNPPGNFISFGLSNTESNITGKIQIISNQFFDRPRVDLNWTAANLPYTSPEFLGLFYGLNKINTLTQETDWGKKYIASNIYPGSAYGGNPYVYFLYNVYEIYHLHGSNPLGKVTDLQGRVLGVRGLTMCDLGIVSQVDANPTLTMLSMCEKIAESLVLNE